MLKYSIATISAIWMAGAANAVIVDTSTCTPLGVVSCSVPGATVTAGGPVGSVMRLVDFRGNSAIGVGLPGDGADGRDLEIQGGKAESLTIEFSAAQYVDRVVLGAYYNPDEFGGDPDEIARITAFGKFGSSTLEITNAGNNSGDLTATPMSSYGTLTRSGVFDLDDGRVTVTDLFAGLRVTRLVFTAADTPKGDDNSDYGVELVATTAVPLPLTAALLPVALGMLGGLRRRV